MYRKRGEARDAKRTITRQAHGAVLELHTNGVPKQHSDWHYDLRRGRLCLYGGLLRFIDQCIASGKPHVARQVVAWLAWYVEDQAGPTTPAELKAVA